MKKRIEFPLYMALALAASAAEVPTGTVVPTERAVTAADGLSLDLSSSVRRVASKGDPILKGLNYSATGWGLSEDGEGCTGSLKAYLVLSHAGDEVALDEGSALVLTNGFTSRGTLDWPAASPVRRREYKLVHEVTKGGVVQPVRTLSTFFTFEDCGDIPSSYEDLRDGVHGEASAAFTLAGDAVGTWGEVGGKGNGVKTGTVAAGGETTLEFHVKGAGAMTFDYALAADAGGVRVTADGLAVADLPAAADWTTVKTDTLFASPLVSHVIAFTFTGDGTATTGAFRLKGASWTPVYETAVTASVSAGAPLDLRSEAWVVTNTVSPETSGLNYSTTGWALEELDEGCTGRLYARLVTGYDPSGEPMLDDGVPIVVADGLTGRGTTAWAKTDDLRRKVYKLVHEVSKGGTVQSVRTLSTFFSFEACEDIEVSYSDLLDGVYGTSTRKYSVESPSLGKWTTVGSKGDGVMTGRLVPGEVVTLSFRVFGAGTFTYEYRSGAGELKVSVDGANVRSVPLSADWAEGPAVSVDSGALGEHVITFAFTATTGFQVGAFSIRQASWAERAAASVCAASGGTRLVIVPDDSWYSPRHGKDVMPFEYSCTNWTGCAGATAESDVFVEMVRLTDEGIEPSDATNLWDWTEAETLWAKSFNGEANFKRRPKKGVWKAKMAIVTDSKTNFTEAAIFDNRNLRDGMLFWVK